MVPTVPVVFGQLNRPNESSARNYRPAWRAFHFRHTGKVLFHSFDRVWPFAGSVSEIGAPNQFAGADAVASLTPYGIVQKAPVGVFPMYSLGCVPDD
jgi:hypothetical protein